MEVTHFGDGVPNCIVDSSFCRFATSDMRNRNREWQGCGHRCESLETITEDEEYVRTMASIGLREADHTKTDRLADGFGSIGSNQHLDSLGDLKISLDVAHGQAKIGGEMHPGDEQFQP